MVVDSSGYQNIVALMVQEQFHYRRSEEYIFYPKIAASQPAFVWTHPTDLTQRKYLTDDEDEVSYIEWVQPQGKIWTLRVGEVLPSGLSIISRAWTWQRERFQRRVLPDWYNDHSYDDPWDIPDSVYITEWVEVEPRPPTADLLVADIQRWERIVAAITSIDGNFEQPEFFHPHNDQMRYPDQHFHDAFTRSAGNFQYTGDSQVDPDQIMQFIFSSPILLVLLLTLPAIYGGIHLSVANTRFPTPIEQLLWKIASINIIATMPVFFLLTFVGSYLSRTFFEYESLGESSFATVYKFPGHVLLLGYMVARSYLVVESFASLRAVPIGTYWTPSWLQMIPHV